MKEASKLKYVRHKSICLITMYIVDVDEHMVIDHLFETSTSIPPTVKKKDLVIEEEEVCRLDPGGMLFMGEPWFQFEVEGYRFEVQLSKVGWVKSKVERAKERIPGCRRIGMWMWNIICSLRLKNLLLEKLEELSRSDEALHAQLDDYGRKVEMEKNISIIFADIPREKR